MTRRSRCANAVAATDARHRAAQNAQLGDGHWRGRGPEMLDHRLRGIAVDRIDEEGARDLLGGSGGACLLPEQAVDLGIGHRSHEVPDRIGESTEGGEARSPASISPA